MILLLAVIIGLAATLVRARLKHRTLKLKKLRWEWLVFVAVLPQVLIFQLPVVGRWIPERILPFILVVTMAGLLFFVAGNWFTPGFRVLGLGLAANFLVIFLNGGWMPVSRETLLRLAPSHPADYWVIGTRLGFTKDRIIAAANTNLGWLSDCLTLPQWFPYKFAFSLGDIFISIGTVILLWSLSSKQEDKK
jgi:hypothetical protein